jgi:hypothetical protein
MRTSLLLLSLLLLSFVVTATHIRAGYIQVKRLNPLNGNCEITVVVYTDGKGPVKIGGDPDVSYLHFGDGQKIFVPETQGVVRLDLDPNGGITEVRFVTTHSYAGFDYYKLSYTEPNRNNGVINMDNSITTLFYLETVIMLTENFDRTPEFLAPPIFYTTLEEPVDISIAATEFDDHTIFYQLTTPGNGSGPVTDYQVPETFKLNLLSGQISWDTKFKNTYQPGEYTFAAKVKQFDGNELMSIVTYDIQIILTEQPVGRLISGNKTVNEHGRIYVPLNTTSKFKVFVEDEHSDDLSIDFFSELMKEEYEGLVSFSTYDSTNNGRNIKVGVIEISNTDALARDNPYPLVVRGIYDRTNLQFKHVTYLIYTRDVEPDTDIVLSAGEENSLLNVYPNPVEGMLHLDDQRIKTFAIYSLEGVLVRSGVPSDDRLIDLRSLTPGFYVLKLNAGRNKNEIVKLIKE